MDLTDAINAAAKATYEEQDAHAGAPEFISWEQMLEQDPMIGHLYRSAVLPGVAAAAPHIQAAAERASAAYLLQERHNLAGSLLEVRARRFER